MLGRRYLRAAFGALLAIGLVTLPSSGRRTAWAQQLPYEQSPVIGQTATRLADGRWLLLGGEGAESRAALWNPQTGATAPTGGVPHLARAWHSATLLPDGTVLIAGGRGPRGEIAQVPELFDPDTGAFMPIAVDGGAPRASHTATLSPTGACSWPAAP